MSEMLAERPKARCVRCGRAPAQISEYQPEVTGEEMSAEEFVWAEEGTLNHENGHFWCTDCYIQIGLPLGTAP